MLMRSAFEAANAVIDSAQMRTMLEAVKTKVFFIIVSFMQIILA